MAVPLIGIAGYWTPNSNLPRCTMDIYDFFKDEIGVPAGITHYVYMVEKDSTNAFGKTFVDGRIEGLNKVDEWAARDMCLRCYLKNRTNKFNRSIVHLSISINSMER